MFVKQDFTSISNFIKALKRMRIHKRYLKGLISMNEQNKQVLDLYNS